MTALSRLSLLSRETRPIPGLLLLSFHKTHADVLERKAFLAAGMGPKDSVTEVMLHKPSGRYYWVTVATEPEAITLSCQENIGECDDCGLVDHHLVTGLCGQCREKVQTVQPAPTSPGPGRAGVAQAFTSQPWAMEQRLRDLTAFERSEATAAKVAAAYSLAVPDSWLQRLRRWLHRKFNGRAQVKPREVLCDRDLAARDGLLARILRRPL